MELLVTFRNKIMLLKGSKINNEKFNKLFVVLLKLPYFNNI